jgi:hypothetical protein
VSGFSWNAPTNPSGMAVSSSEAKAKNVAPREILRRQSASPEAAWFA